MEVGSYQTILPILGEHPEALFELVYHELLIREEIGEHPDSRDYERAYPDLATRLRLQIEVHQAFSLDEDPSFSPQDAGAPPMTEERLPSLPGYTVLGEIGRGGMGVVYRAGSTSRAGRSP